MNKKKHLSVSLAVKWSALLPRRDFSHMQLGCWLVTRPIDEASSNDSKTPSPCSETFSTSLETGGSDWVWVPPPDIHREHYTNMNITRITLLLYTYYTWHIWNKSFTRSINVIRPDLFLKNLNQTYYYIYYIYVWHEPNEAPSRVSLLLLQQSGTGWKRDQ